MSLTGLALAGWVSLSTAPDPGPSLAPQSPPAELVTPGTIGFLATFAIAVALVLLVRDMNRRVRRINVRGARADEALRRSDTPVNPSREGEDVTERDGGDGAEPPRSGPIG